MKILLQSVSTVVKGLPKEKAPKLLESLSKQIDIPLNSNTLKTGVWGDCLLGGDDAGRFIATQGQKLRNGDVATMSRFCIINPGTYSKEIRGISEKEHKSIIEKLAEMIGFPMNMDRTKTGIINGKLVGIEADSGRFISSTIEPLANSIGTVTRTGQVNGVASKVVPLKDLS